MYTASSHQKPRVVNPHGGVMHNASYGLNKADLEKDQTNYENYQRVKEEILDRYSQKLLQTKDQSLYFEMQKELAELESKFSIHYDELNKETSVSHNSSSLNDDENDYERIQDAYNPEEKYYNDDGSIEYL